MRHLNFFITYSVEKEKTEKVTELNKYQLKNIKEQQIGIQERIKELKAKAKELEDSLLEDKISKEKFEDKKNQIQAFLHDKEEELKKLNEKLSKN